jgi:hypothetical protein
MRLMSTRPARQRPPLLERLLSRNSVVTLVTRGKSSAARFAGWWRHFRGRSTVQHIWLLALVLVVGAVLTVGPWYFRGKQLSGAMVSVSAALSTAGASDESGIDQSTVARFDTFQFTIADGWERGTEQEQGENGVLLYLRGPMVEAQHLVVALQRYPVASTTQLREFMEEYKSDWPATDFAFERDITLCGQPALTVGFTNDDGDNLMVFCLHNAIAYVIVLVSPANTMHQHLSLFHEVLGGLQFYE